MRKALLLLVLALGLGACRRSDVRTVHIYVPGMKNAACAKVVTDALGKEQAISAKNVKVDLAERVVTVRYDSLKRSIKNLEFTLADAGFAANNVPTTPKAVNSLPDACGVPKVTDNPRTAGRSLR